MMRSFFSKKKLSFRSFQFFKSSPIGFFIVFSLCLSCAQTDAEKETLAIENAKIHLDTKQCDKAISILQGIGLNSKNPSYLKTLAAAYACKANYSTVTFWGKDLSKISGNASSILGSLTGMSIAQMTAPRDANYVLLQQSLSLLLYAGGVSTPSVTARSAVFSAADAADMNIFALYLIINQLGKYIYYYGNANPLTGIKGKGSSSNGNPNNLSNGCFYDYNPTDATLLAAITAARGSNQLGSCTALATGHPMLAALPNATTTSRMCEGVILFNTFIDLLVNIQIPSQATALSAVAVDLQNECTSNAEIGDLCGVLIQSECEENFASTAQSDKLQAYFFLIFETLFI
jgi:hypothetical protein